MAADVEVRGVFARTLNGLFLGLGIAIFTSACTPYIYPHVLAYCPRPTNAGTGAATADVATPPGTDTPKKVSCSHMPTLVDSVADLTDSSTKIESRIDDQEHAAHALDVATFGLATAFAFKVFQGGALATNSAKNLALSAGATYTAGSLFFPRANATLYLNADLALVCIANRGNGILTAYDQAYQTLSQPPDGSNCPNWGEFKDELAKAQAALATVKNSQATLATKITDAGNNVLATLAQQLIAQYPSPDAILNAGKSAIAAAATLGPSSAQPRAGGAGSLTAPTCDSSMQAKVDAAIADVQAINTLLSQRLNAIGDLSQGCATTVANPIKPLSVSQQDVTVTAGDNNGVVLTVDGGRLGLRAQWTGTAPGGTASFSWVTADKTIRVFGPNSAAKGGPYTLQIVDSAIVPATIEVKVTVK